jgi:hypothetical protein
LVYACCRELRRRRMQAHSLHVARVVVVRYSAFGRGCACRPAGCTASGSRRRYAQRHTAGSSRPAARSGRLSSRAPAGASCPCKIWRVSSDGARLASCGPGAPGDVGRPRTATPRRGASTRQIVVILVNALSAGKATGHAAPGRRCCTLQIATRACLRLIETTRTSTAPARRGGG